MERDADLSPPALRGPDLPRAMMDLSLELFRARHAVFVRKARDAAHQALLFLGVLEKTDSQATNRTLEEHAPFVLLQVDALGDAVHVPEDHDRLRSRIDELPPGERERVEEALSVADQWRSVRAEIDARRTLTLEEVRGVEERIHAFLRRTEPRGRMRRVVSFWLPNTLRYLHKNLALILGATAAVGGALGFEMFRSLFLNEGWLLLLPLAFLAVPHTANRVLIHLYRKRDLTPFWDVAGDAFRSFRFQAGEPDPDVVRWPRGTRVPFHVARGHGARLLAYLVWFAVVCLAYRVFLSAWVGSTSLTVFVILALFYVLLIAGRMLDYWDFLDPRPVRLFVLYLVVGFLVADLVFTAADEYLVGVSLLLAGRSAFRYVRHRAQPMQLALTAVFLLVAAFAVWEKRVGERMV